MQTDGVRGGDPVVTTDTELAKNSIIRRTNKSNISK